MEILEKKNNENVRSYAKRVLKSNIINSTLEPGMSVSENEIANLLGISRTPVREAFIELSEVEIIEILPQKGSRIALIDSDLVEEARFTRLVLEKEIVRLVCENATDEDILKLEENVHLLEFYVSKNNPKKIFQTDNDFHKKLFDIAKKNRTYNMINRLTIHFDRVRGLSLEAVNIDYIAADHKKIADAISNRDVDLAINSMESHLTRLNIDIYEIRKKFPEYFK